VLAELLVGFEDQRLRGAVPRDLVDADALGRSRGSQRVAEVDEVDGVAVTVARSMSPVNGTVMRGCVLKPSSVLITSMSAQVGDAHRAVGLRQLTRRNVFWSSRTW
jgi:hypothetical protein